MTPTTTTPTAPLTTGAVNLSETAELFAIHTENTTSHARALAAAQPLLALKAEELDETTDRHLEDYLVRARRTLALLKERREPWTQAFDRVRAAFTTLENDLDPKKAGSVTHRLQATRDAYAARLRTAELERQEKLRQEQLRLAAELKAATDAQEALQLRFLTPEVSQDPQDEKSDQQARERLQQAVEALAAVEQAAATPSVEVPKGRSSVAITVTDPTAYVALLSLYLERQRPTPPLDKLAKIQLAQLVTWAERLCAETGEVLEHPGLTYAEQFRTVAR